MRSIGGLVIHFVFLFKYIFTVSLIDASCSAGAQSVTVKMTSCGFDLHLRR